VIMSNQKLFNLMSQEFGLTLLDSEMDVIKQAVKEDELMDIGIDTGHTYQGMRVFKRQTAERTCKGCIYSSGSGRCTKHTSTLKCMDGGKEYIFVAVV